MLKKCKSGSGYGLYTCRYGGNNYRVKQRFSKYSDKYDIYEDGVFIDSANTFLVINDDGTISVSKDGYYSIGLKQGFKVIDEKTLELIREG